MLDKAPTADPHLLSSGQFYLKSGNWHILISGIPSSKFSSLGKSFHRCLIEVRFGHVPVLAMWAETTLISQSRNLDRWVRITILFSFYHKTKDILARACPLPYWGGCGWEWNSSLTYKGPAMWKIDYCCHSPRDCGAISTAWPIFANPKDKMIKQAVTWTRVQGDKEMWTQTVEAKWGAEQQRHIWLVPMCPKFSLNCLLLRESTGVGLECS